MMAPSTPKALQIPTSYQMFPEAVQAGYQTLNGVGKLASLACLGRQPVKQSSRDGQPHILYHFPDLGGRCEPRSSIDAGCAPGHYPFPLLDQLCHLLSQGCFISLVPVSQWGGQHEVEEVQVSLAYGLRVSLGHQLH